MAQNTGQRMDRETFLARSLDILSEQGEAELRVDRLTRSLGVTKGSFYWHFEDRADFVRCLAEYWDEVSTNIVKQRLAEIADDPRLRLRTIMETVYKEELTRWDLPMRAWAAHDATVAEVVAKTDRTRLGVCRELFAELGFEGDELEARTRLFVLYTGLEIMMRPLRSRNRRLGSIDAILDTLTTA